MKEIVPIFKNEQQMRIDEEKNAIVEKCGDIFDVYCKKWLKVYGKKNEDKRKCAPDWAFFRDQIIKLPGGSIKIERRLIKWDKPGLQWSIWISEYPNIMEFLDKELTEDQKALVYRVRRDNIPLYFV